MAKPVIFGDFQFRTKRAATKEIRQRVNRYEFGDRLTDNDQHFFESLFKLHEEYAEKVDCGIKYIKVERDFHGNRCLYIHRVNGSKIDISWVRCLTPATPKSIAAMGFRRAVKEIVTSFKAKRISEGAICPVLEIVLDFQNSHVSYVDRSFDSLLTEFLQETNNSYESIELKNPSPDDADQRTIISDSNLKSAWLIFHKQNTSLELWSVEANLRKVT